MTDDFLERAIATLTARLDEHEAQEESLLKDMGTQLAEIYQGWPQVYGASMGQNGRLNELERRIHRVEGAHEFANGAALANLDYDDEQTLNGKHVRVPIEEERARRTELASMRAEVERLRKRVDDSGSINVRALELAAEAKGIFEGKKGSDSIPPLFRPIVVIITRVGNHLVKDGLKHVLTVVGTLGVAWLAHHFGWLGWLLK